MRQRRRRVFIGVVLACAVAAFTASAAQARPATKLTPQQLAEQLRFQGIDKDHGLTGQKTNSALSSRAVATTLTPQQLAEQLRFQGIDKRYGLTGQKTSSVESSSVPVVASSTNGFSWDNAWVAAAVVATIAIILMGGYTVTRRRQHPLGT